MYIKKTGGKVFGVDLNAKERQALELEVRRMVSEQMKEYEPDNDAAILWMLHTQFGFGPKRLRRAWESFYTEMKKLHEYYDMPPEDGPWLCRKMLQDRLGIDIKEWYAEEEAKRDNGNQ